MTRSNNVRALPAGSPVAQIQAKRAEVIQQLDSTRTTMAALKMRRGEAVLGKGPDRKTISEELARLEEEELGFIDALSALDAQERRAISSQSRAEVVSYNESVGVKVARLQELCGPRWQRLCAEAREIAPEVLSLIDAIRVEAAPYMGLGDLTSLHRVPAAMITEFTLALCPPDEPMGAAPFRQTLPAAPSYEMAMEFLRRGGATHLLTESARTLTRELPAETPSPEAA